MQKSVEELISTARLEGYKGKSHNHSDALVLRYNFNIELSKCFYAPLHLLEVAIRNNLTIELQKYLNDTDWLANYKEHSLFQKRESKKIQEALDELSKKGKPFEVGRIVAELNFGFWINLYDRPYMEFQKRSIKNQFPNATNHQRDIFKIKDKLNDIRLLRNRIFHYEPIWHWDDLNNYFKEIKELLLCISKDLCLKSFIASEKEFLEQFNRQKTLLK